MVGVLSSEGLAVLIAWGGNESARVHHLARWRVGRLAIGRSGYTAIGTVCNLAARLCGEAKDGQFLVDQRVAIEVEKMKTLEEIGAITLKGLTQPVIAFNVVPGTSPAEAGPNLTVVARNPRV